jgi:hypothetical protein
MVERLEFQGRPSQAADRTVPGPRSEMFGAAWSEFSSAHYELATRPGTLDRRFMLDAPVEFHF